MSWCRDDPRIALRTHVFSARIKLASSTVVPFRETVRSIASTSHVIAKVSKPRVCVKLATSRGRDLLLRRNLIPHLSTSACLLHSGETSGHSKTASMVSPRELQERYGSYYTRDLSSSACVVLCASLAQSNDARPSIMGDRHTAVTRQRYRYVNVGTSANSTDLTDSDGTEALSLTG